MEDGAGRPPLPPPPGVPPLHWAAWDGDVDTVAAAVASGQLDTVADHDVMGTLLAGAVYCNQRAVVRCLLAAAGEGGRHTDPWVAAVSSTGESACHIAAVLGYHECLEDILATPSVSSSSSTSLSCSVNSLTRPADAFGAAAATPLALAAGGYALNWCWSDEVDEQDGVLRAHPGLRHRHQPPPDGDASYLRCIHLLLAAGAHPDGAVPPPGAHTAVLHPLMALWDTGCVDAARLLLRAGASPCSTLLAVVAAQGTPSTEAIAFELAAAGAAPFTLSCPASCAVCRCLEYEDIAFGAVDMTALDTFLQRRGTDGGGDIAGRLLRASAWGRRAVAVTAWAAVARAAARPLL